MARPVARPMRRALGAVGMVALQVASLLFVPPARVTALRAQEGEVSGTRARAAAALDPDTVRVGEPFTLGLSVAGAGDDELHFPPLLPLEGRLEQLRAPEVRWDGGAGVWRAYYRLVAWEAGEWSLPGLSVATVGGDVEVDVPPVHVTSVLPPTPERPLPLEGPRGPVPLHGFPWWLLLLLLAVALLWWLARRLRERGTPSEEEWVDPAFAAREALDRLVAELQVGRLDIPEFYDGLERVVRGYLAARWGWSEVLPVRDFVHAHGTGSRSRLRDAVLSMEGRAGLVRFAHLATSQDAALRDADTCREWVGAAEDAA